MHAEMYEKKVHLNTLEQVTLHGGWRSKTGTIQKMEEVLAFDSRSTHRCKYTSPLLEYSGLWILYIPLSLHLSHYINSDGKNGFADRWTLWMMMIHGAGH